MPNARWRRAVFAATVSLVITTAVLVSHRPSASGGGTVDDGVPSGTVAFFATGTDCPAGWMPATQVAGRAIVGVTEGTAVGVTVGSPLGDREDRTHVHPFTGQATLMSRGLAAASGSNNASAEARTYAISGTSDGGTSGLPFVQLRACVKP